MPEVTAKIVRDWMNANKRGYSAAASHFAIPEDQLRALCKSEPGIARAPAHTRAIVVDALPGEKRKPGRPKKPQLVEIRDPDPEAELDPIPMPIAVRDPIPEDPLADTLRFYEIKMRECEATLSACPPQAAAPLFRRVMQLREKIDELRAQIAAKDLTRLSERGVIERAQDHAQRLPDPVLEIFVLEYLQRHKLELRSK